MLFSRLRKTNFRSDALQSVANGLQSNPLQSVANALQSNALQSVANALQSNALQSVANALQSNALQSVANALQSVASTNALQYASTNADKCPKYALQYALPLLGRLRTPAGGQNDPRNVCLPLK